jgi:hypothetical protein
LEVISNFVDHLLASTEFLNYSSVFQKRPEKGVPNLRPRWHSQLFEHSSFVAHSGHLLRSIATNPPLCAIEAA